MKNDGASYHLPQCLRYKYLRIIPGLVTKVSCYPLRIGLWDPSQMANGGDPNNLQSGMILQVAQVHLMGLVYLPTWMVDWFGYMDGITSPHLGSLWLKFR